jgi:DNA-binding XRE family transcriptional regulator
MICNHTTPWGGCQGLFRVGGRSISLRRHETCDIGLHGPSGFSPPCRGGVIPMKGGPCMDRQEFASIRRYLDRTQSQVAGLLGISLKAAQSFEQGWRKVPFHIERQLLFILAQKYSAQNGKRQSCWSAKSCPKKKRAICPAWEFKLGRLCWFINGTVCHGEAQESWAKKMKICRNCDVFHSMMPKFIFAPALR